TARPPLPLIFLPRTDVGHSLRARRNVQAHLTNPLCMHASPAHVFLCHPRSTGRLLPNTYVSGRAGSLWGLMLLSAKVAGGRYEPSSSNVSVYERVRRRIHPFYNGSR